MNKPRKKIKSKNTYICMLTGKQVETTTLSKAKRALNSTNVHIKEDGWGRKKKFFKQTVHVGHEQFTIH